MGSPQHGTVTEFTIIDAEFIDVVADFNDDGMCDRRHLAVPPTAVVPENLRPQFAAANGSL